MPWEVRDIVSERMTFIVRLLRGERMTDLCREFGISRKTGYNFWKRFQEEGAGGLYDERRRPEQMPFRTPEAVERLILERKGKHPSWGAKKLKAVLDDDCPGMRIPSRGTIHNILNRHGLVKKRRRRRCVPERLNPVGTSQAANELWCADFKGQFRLGNRAYCYPLTLSDHYSRYLLRCEGMENTGGRGARPVFERAFREYGLPARIRVDNGAPFASRGLRGFSKLSVWWFRLGITVERIEPGHPEQNGRHERMHLTLKQETTRPAAQNFLQQQEKFDRFQEEYNTERPHEALDMKKPADLYHSSDRTYPKELPELDYPLHDVVRRVNNWGHACLFKQNQQFYLGRAFAGENIGLREIEPGNWLVSFMNLDLGYLKEQTKEFEPIL
jgi:transposase InsO family protein